jgi:hypothetical protein
MRKKIAALLLAAAALVGVFAAPADAARSPRQKAARCTSRLVDLFSEALIEFGETGSLDVDALLFEHNLSVRQLEVVADVASDVGDVVDEAYVTGQDPMDAAYEVRDVIRQGCADEFGVRL